MPIEVFCRYSRGATNVAERRVLGKALDILESNQQSAVVLCDFYCRGQQIDLLVATAITTLLLQVKSYHHAVEGTINGASWRNAVSGVALPNGYTQATDQMLALKDMLRERIGRDPGFARTAVLFEQGIPVGSSLPRSDFRVQICDLQGLEELLLTPTSDRSSRVPWDLADLRKYASQEGMARLPGLPLKTHAKAESIAPPSWTRTEPCVIGDVETVTDVQVRAESPTLVLPSIVRNGAVSAYQSAAKESKRLRRTRRALFGLTAILVGVGLGWSWRPAPKQTNAMASDMHRVPSHRSAPAKHHLDRIANASKSAPSPPIETAAAAIAPAASLISSAPPLPPCPEGIDRLGCTPSPETLARLRRQ